MGPPNQRKAAPAVAMPADPGPADDSDRPHASKLSLIRQLHKTKICTFNQSGCCQFGSRCAFAHSADELSNAPDLSKTRLCVTYSQEGVCNDQNCMFAHGEEDLRSTALFYRKTLCVWHQKGKGYCRNGDQCRFAHGMQQLRPTWQRDGGDPASKRAGRQERARCRADGADKGPMGEAAQAGPPLRQGATPLARAPQPIRGGAPGLRAGLDAPGAGSGGLVGPLATPSCEPMKVFAGAANGDEHPGALCGARPYQADKGEFIARRLESLCDQLSVLTLECSRMAAENPREYGNIAAQCGRIVSGGPYGGGFLPRGGY